MCRALGVRVVSRDGRPSTGNIYNIITVTTIIFPARSFRPNTFPSQSHPNLLPRLTSLISIHTHTHTHSSHPSLRHASVDPCLFITVAFPISRCKSKHSSSAPRTQSPTRPCHYSSTRPFSRPPTPPKSRLNSVPTNGSLRSVRPPSPLTRSLMFFLLGGLCQRFYPPHVFCKRAFDCVLMAVAVWNVPRESLSFDHARMSRRLPWPRKTPLRGVER